MTSLHEVVNTSQSVYEKENEVRAQGCQDNDEDPVVIYQTSQRLWKQLPRRVKATVSSRLDVRAFHYRATRTNKA
uniref:Uncharacterized protein n=1 Tax=Tetraselmis sp. GSL018 TaxID=582737 RepID=A0A061S776_9CHLO